MSRKSPTPRTNGFTLVELITVIAIISVLLGLLVVALQASRAAADRLRCANNLRQIGIATHIYHNLETRFPPGAIEPRPLWRHGRQFAWSALLLPHLEMAAVADRIEFSKPFDHPINKDAAASVVTVFLCPSTPRNSPIHNGRGACDYGGIFGERISSPNEPPKGMMLFDRGVRIEEIRDGSSNTLMISEDSDFPDGQWINGRNIFDQAYPINRAPFFENDIRSRHVDGANGVFADGSVRFLTESMALDLLAAICTRDGRETAAW